MQVINNNELFTQVAADESSIASGGQIFTPTPEAEAYLTYMQLASTPASPGGTSLTSGEILFGWNILISEGEAVAPAGLGFL
ncbi:hypothetical protein H5968_21725 [Sphaerospermopsis sp. LEGE 00249]|uniref:hypothetical protein n=1 Tax=Sphaerospermopsis sp. LEGE 00249 TaxID=1380707 RepID=UPI00164CE429|nr:hypothetical protein [Sphaerospermopsis sp. LEGE 00249]MBC5797697.1 hypothetical protein [Sphaerospermopsis sp. LEGE 00249]